jgi:hypothetical protein
MDGTVQIVTWCIAAAGPAGHYGGAVDPSLTQERARTLWSPRGGPGAQDTFSGLVFT